MGVWNMERTLLPNPSNFRRLSMGNWDGIYPPHVYGLFDFDCTETLPYLEEIRQRTGLRITINHLVGRVMALTLRRYPQLNGIIANHKIYLRKNVDIFFQVSIDDAETELVGICIRQADTLGLEDFARHVTKKSEEVRASKAHPMRKAQNPFKYIPWRLIPLAIRFINWIQYDWNLNLSCFGIPQDALGSIMITAVGSLELDFVFPPLTRLGRNPAQVAVGHVQKKAVVIDDQIVIRPRMNLCYTFDHRFMDGLVASKFSRYFRELFEHPTRHADLIEGRIPPETSQHKVENTPTTHTQTTATAQSSIQTTATAQSSKAENTPPATHTQTTATAQSSIQTTATAQSSKAENTPPTTHTQTTATAQSSKADTPENISPSNNNPTNNHTEPPPTATT